MVNTVLIDSGALTPAGDASIVMASTVTSDLISINPAEFENPLIVNDLTTDDANSVLSAAMGKVLKDSLTALTAGVVIIDDWNADTNTPDISTETTTGHAWQVVVSGTTNLGGITDWAEDDFALKTATGWSKLDNTDKVLSVSGKIGAVLLDSSDVGLSNVDNTSDLLKPTSNATQIALDTKEPLFAKNTGFNLPLGNTANTVSSGDHTHVGMYEAADVNIQLHITDVTNNPHNVNAFQVGLSNVDNTADVFKPVSFATQAVLNTKEPLFAKNTGFNLPLGNTANTVSSGDHTHVGMYEAADPALQAHLSDANNPHNTNAFQVGLGNVPNLTAANWPIGDATQVVLDNLQLQVDNFQEIAEYEAGETLNALRVVYVDSLTGHLFKADSSNITTAHSVIGITVIAVTAGETSKVRSSGDLFNGAWSWNMANNTSLFFDENGRLTQTAPTSGYVQRVGFATSPQSIFLRIGGIVAII